MKCQPEFQKQHKVSQVYLKQFGFKQEDGKWYVSVLRVGSNITENILISEFTTETNAFDVDLPMLLPSEKRNFENLSSLLENDYSKILNSIKSQKKITAKHRDIINHYVANLMCRTNPFRTIVNDWINDSKVLPLVLEDVLMFEEEDTALQVMMENISDNNKLNVFIGYLMNHLVKVFRGFKSVIIKSESEFGWLTTDSPVKVDWQDECYTIIPLETELYFPLSKDLLLFLYHPSSKKQNNLLRSLAIDKVNNVDFNTFNEINLLLARDYDEYLVFYESTPIHKIFD